MSSKYIHFRKNTKIPISVHFNSLELQCQCKYDDCVEQLISETLISKLEKIRSEFGKPLKITSAFRCAKHQSALRSSGIQTAANRSQHELGNAVDIRPVQISEDSMDELFELLESEFKAIGIAKTFYHVDLRSDKERRWDYI